MKAMSHTLYLVVAAIVILVTAVVVIAIFFQGITPAMGLTEAKSLCLTQATMSCATYCKMPPTWNIPNVKVTVGGKTETKACSAIEGLVSCTCTDGKLECSAPSNALEDCSNPAYAATHTDCQ